MIHSDEHITSLPLHGRLRGLGAWGAVKGHLFIKLRDRSHLKTTSSMSSEMGCMVTNVTIHT